MQSVDGVSYLMKVVTYTPSASAQPLRSWEEGESLVTKTRISASLRRGEQPPPCQTSPASKDMSHHFHLLIKNRTKKRE